MVLVGISSKKGNKLIADAGFPTFTMFIGWAGIDTIKNEFSQMGTLLGNEQKADELIKYWDQKLAYINAMVSKVPQDQKKHVLYTSRDLISVSGKNVWGDSLITASGGLNAAAEITDGSKASIEQIMKWNPDVIIVQKNGNAAEELKKDSRISDLKAIKNGQVYQVPIGAFWWDRPSPESPLGFMWLATKLYPEYTKEIDLKRETKEFFKEFYNYDLSDEEYNSFF
jgi:iron complex transport system substrate-binding protein